MNSAHQNIAMWACTACGRTVQVRLPADCTPNRICNCRFPSEVRMMSPVTEAARQIEAAVKTYQLYRNHDF
jgi:hypothetical protein